MDRDDIRKLVREEVAGILMGDKMVISVPAQIHDGRHITVGRASGTKVATAADQKLGFFGVMPVIQRTAIASPSGGLTVDGPARAAIDSIRQALIDLGLTA